MNAAMARQLRAGDKVEVAFGTSTRRAVIRSIRWPHFEVYTILRNGEERTQLSRYRALKPDSPNARAFGE